MDPVEWLTLALILITGYYAWQTRATVVEMRRSRELQVRPKLAPEFVAVGPLFGLMRLSNVGQGPALDVRIDVVFVGHPGVETVRRHWMTDLLAPGQSHDFLPPKSDGGQLMDIDEWTAKYQRLAVKGSLKDALGRAHEVDEVSAELEEMWQTLKASGQRVDQDDVKRIADDLKKIASAVEKISKR